MNYISAGDRLQVRIKMRNNPVSGTLNVMVHAIGQPSLIGASHG